ncbi:retinol dehydrogenase 12-like [Mercenaria mercenaria]|uniref:retinol dehydrogenase 12-like n=1 Tax=Mercenaria mercenaria TaxID=6596 RepID=UPI00234FAC9F|nr:retinol dehydrogenase 12-like [Mercenaria mercenaria]
MAHGSVKKAQSKPPAASSTKTTKTETTKQKSNVGQEKTVVPPKQTPKYSTREKQIIWEDDNDLDIEDITFVVPIIISVIILFVFFLRKYIRWNVNCQSNNRIEGKTVIITGANTGIGRATATELARRGGRVILGCRDKLKGEAVANKIRSKTRNQDVYAYELDLGRLTSVKEFVENINRREPLLHVLINNAAYMGPRETTSDGYERNFGVNYLGHFYLTNLLTDKLKRSAPSRVINLVSDSYTKGKLDFDDLAMTNYDVYKAYGRSKLAMVIFTMELHRRLSPFIVHSFGVHPGMVCTDLLRNWPGLSGNVLRACARVFFKSPEEGCQTVVFSAVADKLRDMSGKVLENCTIYKIKNFAKEKELGTKLWIVSLQLCGLADQIPETEEDVVADNRESTANGKQQVENVGQRNEEQKKEK